MSSRYPVAIDVNLPIATNTAPISANLTNEIRSALLAVQAELGLKPSGSFGTIRARLDSIEGVVDTLSNITPVSLTLGGITSPGSSGIGSGRIYFDSVLNVFRISENGGVYRNLSLTPSAPNRSLQINNGGVFGTMAWTNPASTQDLFAPADAGQTVRNEANSADINVWRHTSLGGGDRITFGVDGNVPTNSGATEAGLYARQNVQIGTTDTTPTYWLETFAKDFYDGYSGGTQILGNMFLNKVGLVPPSFGNGVGVFGMYKAITVPTDTVADTTLLYIDPTDKNLKYLKPDGTTIDTANSGTTTTVADDIAKSAGTTVDRVRGLRGIAIDGYDGAPSIIGAVPVYNEQDGYSYKLKKPTSEGGFNIVDYGARPSLTSAAIGLKFDCTPAFIAARNACNPTGRDISDLGRHGEIIIPPAPPGYEWYFAGEINDNFGSMPHLEVDRQITVKGFGNGSNSRGGSRLRFGPLMAGFRPVGSQGSTTGGDGTGARFEGLTIFCTPLSDTIIQRGWKSNNPYTKGELIRPHRFHNLYYECLKNGTSNGPTPSIGDCTKYAVDANYFDGPTGVVGNRWRPAKTYTAGDRVYPNRQCGKILRCTVGGTTCGLARFDGEATDEWSPAAGQHSTVGEPDWFSVLTDPSGSTYSTVREALSGVTWALDVADPEPVWNVLASVPCLADFFKPNHAYTNGAWVFGDNFDRIFVAQLADPTIPQMSGASPPAGFATAKYPTEVGYVAGDDIVVAGGITWHCNPPIGIVADGGTFWAARVAGAYQIYAPTVEIRRPFVTNAPTSAIGCYSIASTTQSLFSDTFRILGPGQLLRNGIGIYAIGGDSNAGITDNMFMNGDTGDYWGDPADHIIDDASFLGNHFSRCIFQGCGGWAIGFRGESGSGTLSSSYIEGNGCKGPLTGVSSVVGGGTIQSAQFRLNGVDINSANSSGGPSLFKDKATNLHTETHSDHPEGFSIRAAIDGGRRGVFGFSATNDASPGTLDDTAGYQLNWGQFSDGTYWDMTHLASGRDVYHLAGASNTSIGPGNMWFRQGFALGATQQTYFFGDNDAFASIFVRGDVRNIGDQVYRPDKAARGNYAYRVVCDDGGKAGGIWQPQHGYNPGDIITPTPSGKTANHRSFQAASSTTPFLSGVSEPVWNDTLGGSTSDGYVTWTTIAGPDEGFVGLIEDGSIGLNIQPNNKWADGYDTDPRIAVPKTSVRGRRGQAQTTTGTASQVLDDGVKNTKSPNDDLTLPTDCTTIVDVTLVVKQNGSAEGGSIRLSGTFYRNSSGAPVRVGTDDNTAKLSGGLSSTAALVINGNAVELQCSPGSAITLDWRWTRVHTEGKS